MIRSRCPRAALATLLAVCMVGLALVSCASDSDGLESGDGGAVLPSTSVEQGDGVGDIAWVVTEVPFQATSASRLVVVDGRLVFIDASAQSFAWDRTEGTWEGLPEWPLEPRVGASVAAVGGKVVVWGGRWPRDAEPEQLFSDGAVLDIASRTWTEMTPTDLGGRSDAVAVGSGDQVYLWGGVAWGGSGSRPTEANDGAIYDTAQGDWSRIESGPVPGRLSPAGGMTDGALLVFGGERLGSATVGRLGDLQPDGGEFRLDADPSWAVIPSPPVRLAGGSLVTVVSDRIVVVPNIQPDAAVEPEQETSSVYLYEPADHEWRAMGPTPLGDRGVGPYVSSGDLTFVFGGSRWADTPSDDPSGPFGPVLHDAYVYDVSKDEWTQLPDPPVSITTNSALAASEESVYVVASGKLLTLDLR